MALKYQFNKIAMQNFQKQLKIRLNALPTLKSKEAALRVTVKRIKEELENIVSQYNLLLNSVEKSVRVWAEFEKDIFDLKEANLKVKKIAGIKTPEFVDINYTIKEYSNFLTPAWYDEGIEILKKLSALLIKIEVQNRKIAILDYARKKTTQKVNLYEKVQIPAFTEAIRKIKRYLEDVENLEKAAQKITKQKQAEAAK